MNIINLLPNEIVRKIYKYLNPISKPIKTKKNIIWCKNCGEVLKGGDWLLSLGSTEEYLYYECKICLNEYYFEDPDIWDILIQQEINM